MKAIEYPKLLASAIAVLKRQGVISYPTEGVWGLGCDPMSEVAVRKVPVSYTHLTLPTKA